MKTKITDVAKLAGVSSTTVSHVLNNTRFVTEQTRKKVLRAVKELGYSPDATARMFKTGKKMMIGFVVPDISNAVFATLIECVENIVALQGYKLVVVNTKDSLEQEKKAIEALSYGLMDGLIIASSAYSFEDIRPQMPNGFPVVLVDRTLAGYQQDSIVLDCYHATFDLLSDLIREGHRKIGYIVGLPHLSSTADRIKAYWDAIAAHQIEYDPSLIRTQSRKNEDAFIEAGKLVDIGCSAIVATNTMMTHDVLNCLEQRGIKPNEDIAIGGFVDSYLGKRFAKSIPVVFEPIEELGDLAGKMIIEKINKSDEMFPIKRIPCSYHPNKKREI